MTIRYATAQDKMAVVRGLQNKGLTYNTTAQAKSDIENGDLLVAEINGKIVGSLAVVATPFGYTGLKRACVYNKKNCGKGIMSALFDYALSLEFSSYGCTPWADNAPMIAMLSKRGLYLPKNCM